MSLSFTREVIRRLRDYGVVVHLWSGYESRGNGQVSNYQGIIMHHTATQYGFAPNILVSGRSDLPGPLCNSAGNADGSITIIAAHPANHAGASGGRSMGPLPKTNTFNKIVWGHEIVYPGTSPMTQAQYRTMIILGRVITEILKRPNSEWVRAHGETSITGKWDPGFASGRTIDMNLLRRDINNFVKEEEDMALKDDPDGIAMAWRVEALTYGRNNVIGGPTNGEPVALVAMLKQNASDIAELKSLLSKTLTVDSVKDIIEQVVQEKMKITGVVEITGE
jgi:hypothetical protein